MRSAFSRRNLFVMATIATFVFVIGLALAQTFTVQTIDRLPPGELLGPRSRGSLPVGVKLRSIYPPGIDVTKLSEGWSPHLYNDAVQYCTIGYGHLVEKAPCDGTEPIEFRHGLTKPRGEEILVSDLASSQYTVMTSIKVPLTDGQFAALTDFVFNVGSAKFRESTLLKVVNAKQQGQVPGQFRRWVLAGGKQWDALVKRREREINLFFDGLPKTRGTPLPSEDLSPVDINKGESPTVQR